MALWCMMSAPLFMSNDLRSIREEEKNILLNKKLIEVDQVGTMAKIVVDEKPTQVWVKKLAKPGHFAVLYLNRETLGSGKYVSTFYFGEIRTESFAPFACTDHIRLGPTASRF